MLFAALPRKLELVPLVTSSKTVERGGSLRFITMTG